MITILKYVLMTRLPIYLETWKNLEFDNFGKKKPEVLTILTCSVVKFQFDSKNLSYNKKNCHHQNYQLKNTFKLA